MLIENCTAIGASDAGLYVGQCRNVVVRSSRAKRNVAGIEIENTIDADVYDNIATNNTGGILVFDLPGLPQKAGRNVRVYQNEVVANNHKNFAAPGNVVAGVPPGTGLMVMATDRVEVFDNDIRDNNTSSVSILSYKITGTKIKDPHYDPIPEAVSVHGNRISGGGRQPRGAIGVMLTPVLGATFPDILFDGVTNPARLVDGELPAEFRHSIKNNGDATYANFNLPLLSPQNVLTGKFKVETDLAAMANDLATLPPVKLRPHDAPTPNGSPAVRAYRAAPEKLSAYGLFQVDGSTQEPVDGVVPYDLNTPLFSDYTTKRRFIRIPDGTQIDFKDDVVFDFPVGTVIAKTFSYPHDMRDLSKGEQLLETRIETRGDDGWYGYSYIWNDEQTEATLALGGSEREASWIHADGSDRTIKYQIPNANQCLNCHSQAKEFVPIGPVAANLNRDFKFAHGTENQLDYLDRLGMLQGKPPTETIHEFGRFDDAASGTLDERARAWLHVNCAHCHSPLGTARTSGLDLRIGQNDPAKYGVWKSPIAAGHGTGGREYDIVPGQPDKSIMLFRLESTDPSIMMPNVAKRLVPAEGVALVRDWIREME